MSTQAEFRVFCSPAFKEWLKDFAKRKKMSISEAVIEELTLTRKFDNFQRNVEIRIAPEDPEWEMVSKDV